MTSPDVVVTLLVSSSGVFPSIQAFFAQAAKGVPTITAAARTSAVIFFHILMVVLLFQSCLIVKIVATFIIRTAEICVNSFLLAKHAKP